ncbi:GIY-YIG nuclease family protein [Leptolyngbya sp. 15MV]|nr:GIY-YIG nuclease family protein [Leptolyngbya sp. 15MV]
MTLEERAAETAANLAQRVSQVRAKSEPPLVLPMPRGEQKLEYSAMLDAAGLGLGEGKFLYSVSLPAEPKQMHDALLQAREQHRAGRAYCRVLKFPQQPTRVLYVGSSSNLKKRILEHLGFGAQTTYALHLRFWAQGFGDISINIMRYPAEIELDLFLFLEDQWARELIPLFGRRGSL